MLFCPIRGFLAGRRKQADLSESEELRRIEVVKLLLESGYAKERIDVRTVLVDPARGLRPSLRADVAVYDRPVALARRQGSVARRRDCIRLVACVGRDRDDGPCMKEEQLRPALTLIDRNDCVGLYWGEAEQCMLVKQPRGAQVQIVERPASRLSFPAEALAGTCLRSNPVPVRLRRSDLRPATDLVKPFARLDDILRREGLGKEDRQGLLVKLLLMKVRDEQRAAPGQHLIIQELSCADVVDPTIHGELQDLLTDALRMHGELLPSWVGPGLPCSSAALSECSRVLCAFSVLDAAPQVLQDFFLHFGRGLYRLDLGRCFTPHEVLDLVMQIVNPRAGERLLDPACGTAEFLAAAGRLGLGGTQLQGLHTQDGCLGAGRLNLLLHAGDAGGISDGDSLQALPDLEGRYALAVCSPPFGVRLLEKRPEVLQHYALGRCGGSCRPQETGLLFVELCLRAVAPGGRAGLILPNGYLGNRGPRYVSFRRWLLCHARIVSVIGFPRFTFKRAGADVSASAVVLERRAQALPDLSTLSGDIHFDLLDKVGWDLSSTPSCRLYRRDPHDGSLLRDAGGAPIPDADFDRVLSELRASGAAAAFPWMLAGVDAAVQAAPAGRCPGVPACAISAREDLSLDPKRWCPKHARVVAAVRSVPHLELGEVVRPVTRAFRARREVGYRYVEIEDIYECFGAYTPEDRPGWALPRRAKLCAAPGDIFIANIWSSAGKWMIAGQEARDGRLVVTNGCSHFEVIPGQEARVPDLVFGLCSEAFKVQMRARASGSDGLSWISVEDILSVVLPRRPRGWSAHGAIEQRIKDAQSGHMHLPGLVSEELALLAPAAAIAQRSSHTAQV
jgi:type I restriction enzyme M protein